LKGYTIGVEVLRRDASFNPQLDPIVRVEATRLRRAIDRYYSGPGASDPIQIDLPRGGYAPRISWRDANHTSALATAEQVELGPGNGLPMLRVAPFTVSGTPQTRSVAAESLSSRIADAFALSDGVNVSSGAVAGRADYVLDGALEYHDGGTVDLRFKLTDEADGTVIWSRFYEQIAATDVGARERRIIADLATAVVEPFGIITANDRSKRFAGGLDPRYQALLAAGDTLRSYDPAAHLRVRERLEQLTALDPNFAQGFTVLAALHVREFMVGLGARPNDTPALDRALKAARRGIELRPQSARGYHILFIVQFLRGEKEAGIAAAEKAMELNPYDLLIMAEFGGRLIYCGEVDRGMALLNEAARVGAVLPSWSHFSLFVGHYVRGEFAEARYHASQLTSETYVYGQLARALTSYREGDDAETRRAMQAIIALQPAWRDAPRRELGKLINAASIADRLVDDLVAAGWPGTHAS
jgi:tetratricopeptide (TPR) repeat protein